MKNIWIIKIIKLMGSCNIKDITSSILKLAIFPSVCINSYIVKIIVPSVAGLACWNNRKFSLYNYFKLLYSACNLEHLFIELFKHLTYYFSRGKVNKTVRKYLRSPTFGCKDIGIIERNN